MIREFKPPEQIDFSKRKFKIFLAGTIDMGSSVDWQSQFIKSLDKSYNIDFYNPRRVEWNAGWKQSFESPEFFQQVTWELDAMNKADLIIMNLLGDSKSPISLLELGLHANSKKILVCCPNEFYRSGNVQIVCNAYNIPLFNTMTKLKEEFNQNYLKYGL